MRPYRWIPLLITGLTFIPTTASAFSGAQGASFLEVPVGAGPASLGSAYTSWARDVYAPVWNAGGLGFVDSTEIGGMHQSYVESTNFEFVGVVHPLKEGRAIGFSAQYFRPGDLDRTDIDGNVVGTFGGHSGAYSLAYGQKITETLAMGITGKLIETKIDDVSATAYAGDAGVYYQPTHDFTMGAAIANVGSSLKYLSESDPLPLAIRGGASYRFFHQVRLATEGVYRKNAPASFHAGIAWPSEDDSRFSIRTGYSSDRTRQLSAAAGIAVGIAIPFYNHEMSYAFTPLGDLGAAHYFSLILRFGENAQHEPSLLSPSDRENIDIEGGFKLMKDSGN